jgi:voltage-gated potassium channel
VSEVHPLRSRLRGLYYGHTQDALRFQGVLLILDIAIVGFFIVSQFIRAQSWYWIVDIAIAVFLALDMIAKGYALGSVKRWLKYPATWADIVVLGTLIVPLMSNWGFLRLLRLWTLVNRERFWNVLGGGKWDDTYVEDLTQAIVTLVVFVFIAAGAAQALFLRTHPEFNNFVDAIYFVVASLTTTGYGDIALKSTTGRLFSIGLMIAGISLFFSLAQKVFASPKKIVRCEECGLDRHDRDARNCKICGTELGPALRGRARHLRG